MPGIPGPGGCHDRAQGEQTRLIGNSLDQVEPIADAGSGLHHAGDQGIRALGMHHRRL